MEDINGGCQMKHSRIFRISAVATVLALLLTAIPATPALAQTIDYQSPSSGPVGTPVTITGSGFTPSAYYTITFYNTTVSFTQVVAASIITSGGSFSTTFVVPECPKATYTVQVTSGVNNPYTYFTVTPKIELNKFTGYVGDEVKVSGTGFAADKGVTITFHNVNVGTAETNILGSFTNATFTVPESYRGIHTVKATDASNYYDTATFTTKQSITVSPTSGAVGNEVTVSGTGFRDDKPITITFDSIIVTTSPATVTTDDNGSFSNATFTVPTAVNDTYKVKANDGYYDDSADFTVAAGTTLNQTTGNVGTSLVITGTGFVVNGTVTVTYDNIQVATATVSTDGTFSATFEVPASEGGDHTITATDGTNTITSTFTMESTSPPIPVPLLPTMDSKASAEAHFDWEDVTDLSLPVTYTLQIATDDQFTTASILLEKTGLTESEYTLASEESLASVERENPYYWRVRAIDGASNESGWTGTGSFYVGFSFDMPTWLIYTLFGLGAVLLGVLGFWLGRRTAYY